MTVSLVSTDSAMSPTSSPMTAHMVLDRELLMANLNTRACWVRHNLANHPLFEMSRLLQLAKYLPDKYVRINNGRSEVATTPDQIPGRKLSIEESFERMAETDTRIMLKKIELEPAYQRLLHECIDEIVALGHPSMQGIWYRVGYVFISAPNQTTPYHMDPEINFLLQVRGNKTFFVLNGEDRSILSEEALELFFSGRHHSLAFDESWRGKAVAFEMAPGTGVHIPVTHPHWVTTPNEISISLALTVQTHETQRRGMIYGFNDRLRHWGITPTPFGQSATGDWLKYHAFRAMSAAKSILQGKKQDTAH
ncbi:MAG TPA: hypothetical protein VFE62_18030 [Gemmataceae bacterium]|nr:hypothetical protein [Gemmataceae bacterium]